MEHEHLAIEARGTPDGLKSAGRAILAARQFLHCRRGLPLAFLGSFVLTMGLLTELQVGAAVSLPVLAISAAVLVALLAFAERRQRSLGLWARAAGEPSLDSPTPGTMTSPVGGAWWNIGLMLLAALLVASALLSGATLGTVLFWVIAYGMFHVGAYGLSLGVNLGLREQLLSAAWFVAGGLYWVCTGKLAALVFGGGWLLMGLLLFLRLRRVGRLALPDFPDAPSR